MLVEITNAEVALDDLLADVADLEAAALPGEDWPAHPLDPCSVLPSTATASSGACTRSRLKGHSTQRLQWIGASYVAGAGDHGRPRPAKTRSRNEASVIGRYRRASPIAGSADGVRCQWPKKRRSSGERSHVSPAR